MLQEGEADHRQHEVVLQPRTGGARTGAPSPKDVGSLLSTCQNWMATGTTAVSVGCPSLSNGNWYKFSYQATCRRSVRFYCMEKWSRSPRGCTLMGACNASVPALSILQGLRVGLGLGVRGGKSGFAA